MKLTQIKSIIITGKQWFDKVNGNSYCAARATINFGLKSERQIVAPFEYGYGSFYEQAIYTILAKENSLTYSQFLSQLYASKIRRESSLQKGCLKREVVAWGQA